MNFSNPLDFSSLEQNFTINFFSLPFQCHSQSLGLVSYGTALETTASNWFDHLDTYSLLHILDYLEPVDLLPVAELSSRLQQIIADYYITSEYRVHEKGLCIYATNDTQAAVVIRLTHEQRPFSGQHVVQRVFHTFGHTIRRLNVHIHSMDRLDDIHEIDRCIRTYSGNILHEIVFYNLQQELLFVWRVSLEAVTSVTLAGTHVSEFSTDLNTFFPKLRKLTIEVESTRNLDCISKAFPHLLELTVKMSFSYDMSSFVMNALRMNPQIRVVRSSQFGDTAFLRAVNDNLPHLESFAVMTHLYCLYDLNRSGQFIRFENVMDLSITIGDRDHGGFSTEHRNVMVRFDRLKSLELTLHGPGSVDSLITFAGEYKTLTKLRINSDITHQHLQRIIQLLPVLQEITVEFNSILMFDEIRPFFMVDTELKRLIVIFRTFAWNRNDIQLALSANWSFIERNTDAFRTTLLFFQVKFIRPPVNLV